MTRSRRVRALAVLVLLGGCASGPSPAPAPSAPPPPQFTSYVALGDSFTAAPLVPTTDLARGCLRSDRNYPALLARRLDISEVTDVSCSGATTEDLRGRQPTVPGATVPPQLRALDPDTDLVTLGIGGNDFALFGSLVRTCTRLGGVDAEDAPCTERLRAQGVDLLGQTRLIGRRVAASLEQIRRRAPRARVVLVGYPRLVPRTDTCPRRLPLAPGDYDYGARLGVALNLALRSAARRAGADFVDMYPASRGHDICAEEPWVNGRRTDRSAALAYHPFAAGMAAVADEVEQTLS